MNVMYSVVIPHYNDTERLERFLKSVPKARKDIEVIVVDDCSPNQTSLDVVRRSWRSVRWLSTSHNAGAGVARNVGLEATTGRWLMFADSDDEFMPGAFDIFDNTLSGSDELIYFLAEGIHEADGSYSLNVERINDYVRASGLEPTIKSLRELQLHHVVPWAKIYSTAFVRSTGIRYEPVRYSNDIAFNTLVALEAKHIRSVPIKVYRYYIHKGSLTTDETLKAFMLRFNESCKLSQRLKQKGIKNVRSAAGYMVRSLKYGPCIALQVWLQALRSPMRIDFLRFLHPNCWSSLWSSKTSTLRERNRKPDNKTQTDK